MWPGSPVDAYAAGALIGQKIVLDKFSAFATLAQVVGELSAQAQAIATFAPCGLAILVD